MRLTALMVPLLLFTTAMPSRPAQQLAPPTLTVPGEAEGVVLLQRADVRIVSAGPLTQVTQTLTFLNKAKRVLEGELTFPLPDGAAVSGFALDVKGELVDAVPVEKDKARLVFEKEVRKNVDPGLLEQLEGNVFRTRVYPIPAGGTRTIRITYTTDKRVIPLRYGARVPEGQVTIERFGANELRVLENAAEQDIDLGRASNDTPVALIEPFQRATATRPESYFYVTQAPPQVKIERAAPHHIGVVWDASLSRRKAEIGKELTVLSQHLSGLSVAVDVIVLRERAEPVRTFTVRNGDTRELLAFLRAQPFDGGTALSALRLAHRDYWLWFTDGYSNLGQGLPTIAPQTPVYAVNTQASANTALLRYVCDQTGGALSEGTDPKALGQAQVELLAVENAAGVADVQWQDGVVTGRLLRDEAQLTLVYGLPGQVIERRTVTLEQRSGQKAEGLVARQWAAQRANRLALLPDENREALLALGKDFNLVTPGTSLLVLESLEQYVEHNIAPPRSRPALYDAWLAREKTEKDTRRGKDEQQLQRVLNDWNERLAWHKKEFPRTYTPPRIEKDKARTLSSAGMSAAGGRALGRGNVENRGLTENRPLNVAPRPAIASAGSANQPRARERNNDPLADVFRLNSAYSPATATELAKRGQISRTETDAGIEIKAWTPDTPYLKVLRAAGPTGAYAAYLAQREKYGDAPAFYLDCAETLLQLGQKTQGLRVLSSLADFQIDDPALLRVLAHRLAQLGERELAAALFEKILRLRPEEPQSYRDLALVLGELGRAERALTLLHEVVMRHWDRFDGIEGIALTEANSLIARYPNARHAFDPRLLKSLPCDIRIVMTWDSDNSDMDLHVIEPTGEECFYGHNRTQVGGRLSNDFTQGYGPEEYLIRRAVPGVYKIRTNYFGSQEQKITGGTTVQATVITNFGRSSERRQHLTLRLTQNKETVTIGEIRFAP